jgi:phosphoglycerol transferase
VPRQAFETEVYGLKIAQLLLPVDSHRWPVLARVKQRYNDPSTPCLNENAAATLGVVGSAGFLLLLGRMALGRRGRGSWLDGLAILTLSGLLLATVGGFGSLFSLLVSPLIRTPNRISIYLAFFALTAVGLVLTRVAGRVSSPLGRSAWYAALALLLAVGIVDQTPRFATPPYAKLEEAYRHDEAYVHRLETILPAGAMIFQLPYVPYVEHSPVHEMVSYGHLQGYLHSQSLRWSYGAMQGREGDRWQKAVAALPPAELIRELTMAGFAALWIDRRGYPDHGQALETRLGELLGAAPVVSEDGQRVVFLLPQHSVAQGMN